MLYGYRKSGDDGSECSITYDVHICKYLAEITVPVVDCFKRRVPYLYAMSYADSWEEALAFARDSICRALKAWRAPALKEAYMWTAQRLADIYDGTYEPPEIGYDEDYSKECCGDGCDEEDEEELE